MRAPPGAKPLSHALIRERVATKNERDSSPAERISAVAPGDVSLIKPIANEIVTASNPALVLRLAAGWSPAITLNGHVVNTAKLTPVVDQATHTATFTVTNANLVPGPNRLRVSAIGPAGQRGKSVEIPFHRSGPPKRFEINPVKRELTAGGSDLTSLRVRAFDAWNKPAVDTPVNLTTSRGEFDAADGKASKPRKASSPPDSTTPLDLHNIGAGASGGNTSKLFKFDRACSTFRINSNKAFDNGNSYRQRRIYQHCFDNHTFEQQRRELFGKIGGGRS